LNEIIRHLQSHGSTRAFAERPIAAEDELTIVTTAERSPTSSNLHTYSIISVRDARKKASLSELCGNQAHVKACPLFLVFCADLHRLHTISRNKGYVCHSDYAEIFIVATVDAALAADRALTAAQALGMGGVMVGAIRNHPREVGALLSLPELVYPVVGMSLGYPANPAKVKPRLPLRGLWFKETYDEAASAAAVEEYDRIIAAGGHLTGRELDKEKYPDFKGTYSWSEHSARRLASDAPTALRPHMLEYLREQGFLKK
jgi:FMN reductase (NADPH)